ncbi:putative MFS-type transporter [Pseudomonas synxantha]|nr:putative MFS-type transporter [Pseudomonas synxantha]
MKPARPESKRRSRPLLKKPRTVESHALWYWLGYSRRVSDDDLIVSSAYFIGLTLSAVFNDRLILRIAQSSQAK